MMGIRGHAPAGQLDGTLQAVGGGKLPGADNHASRSFGNHKAPAVDGKRPAGPAGRLRRVCGCSLVGPVHGGKAGHNGLHQGKINGPAKGHIGLALGEQHGPEYQRGYPGGAGRDRGGDGAGGAG